MSRLQEEFDNYIKSVFDGELLPKTQQQELRRAFFGGAVVALTLGLSSKEVAKGLTIELLKFSNDVQRGVK